jgi:hypothetical protein
MLINEKAEFEIDFAEPVYGTTPTEEATYWQTRIANGVATGVDWIMSDNPDLSREDAELRWAANKAMSERKPIAPLTQPGKTR